MFAMACDKKPWFSLGSALVQHHDKFCSRYRVCTKSIVIASDFAATPFWLRLGSAWFSLFSQRKTYTAISDCSGITMCCQAWFRFGSGLVQLGSAGFSTACGEDHVSNKRFHLRSKRFAKLTLSFAEGGRFLFLRRGHILIWNPRSRAATF